MNESRLDPTLPDLAFDERGLVPVVTQDAKSGEVLMLAYADREAVEKTLEMKEAHYFSRSRNELWRKGASSGNVQKLTELRYDCDADALLYRVEQTGPACHSGERSCFYRGVGEAQPPSLGEVMALLEGVIAARLRDLPEGSYVTSLHERGLGRIAQKVVEEAGETVVAALERNSGELVDEAADLLFHLVLLLRESGVTGGEVAAKLAERHQAMQGR
ncbi:MAG: bifunctional phosphoribosyl-AMP cyclohydrolase/phosphoribosyl-ATP diphosphatase HisIE [Deinococcota bacterium]|jgi:phosphoribosyl-ATP pyrophosphohydrolase/phosphoribosyl-AMP cyclohydrolase|nr:bifunctional phosphoribosyl-AMP cyclohydrolase/phosphoribosyl-ATP diphosphatase HisIE [Deinococcota bacterium]